MPVRFLLFLAILAFALPGHARRAPLVLAAASLQESLTAAADAWAARGHPRPVLSFAGSSTLARQIASGAPADLFVSADEAWMDDAARRGLIRPGSRVPLVGNRLVLIAPRGAARPIAIGRGFLLARALGNGRLAMADPDAVPAGRYARQALRTLGVWPSVAGRIVPAENVRAALTLVARGEAPLGIVYETDARAAPAVAIVGRFPAASHPPIRYPIAVLKTATSADAEPFRRFLLSRAGQAIFARYGFRKP